MCGLVKMTKIYVLIGCTALLCACDSAVTDIVQSSQPSDLIDPKNPEVPVPGLPSFPGWAEFENISTIRFSSGHVKSSSTDMNLDFSVSAANRDLDGGDMKARFGTGRTSVIFE